MPQMILLGGGSRLLTRNSRFWPRPAIKFFATAAERTSKQPPPRATELRGLLAKTEGDATRTAALIEDFYAEDINAKRASVRRAKKDLLAQKALRHDIKRQFEQRLARYGAQPPSALNAIGQEANEDPEDLANEPEDLAHELERLTQSLQTTDKLALFVDSLFEGMFERAMKEVETLKARLAREEQFTRIVQALYSLALTKHESVAVSRGIIEAHLFQWFLLYADASKEDFDPRDVYTSVFMPRLLVEKAPSTLTPWAKQKLAKLEHVDEAAVADVLNDLLGSLGERPERPSEEEREPGLYITGEPPMRAAVGLFMLAFRAEMAGRMKKAT
jgi:hypothetical protein